jgi:hypothetical protein
LASWRPGVILLLAILSCSPFSNRPRITPFPEASQVEVRTKVPEATQRLITALTNDSIPLIKQTTRDGYVESPWLDSATMRPTSARPVGPGVVKLRGWVDPGRVGYSVITVEGAYRRMADPSLPERELESPVPENHPVRFRIDSLLARIPTAR